MEFVDTHCHPQFEAFDADREELLQRSSQAGVTKLIVVGCSLADSQRAIDFAAKHTGVWATAGVHPHDATNFMSDKSATASLSKMLKAPKIVAVGEIGLDYYRDLSPRAIQEKVLRTQIEMGLEIGLPFVFHIREAWKGFWPIFDSYKALKGVVHSFSASLDVLDQALSRGLYIGLNGLITYTKDDSWRESARRVPLNKLLLETDAPFLTPVPFRGQRCEPKHTATTAKYLAELRQESLGELASATTQNAVKLFGLDVQEKLKN